MTNALDTLDDITNSLDEDEGLVRIYLDYRKAFDSVQHTGLKHKFKSYGLCDVFHKMDSRFLEKKKQRVFLKWRFLKPRYGEY